MTTSGVDRPSESVESVPRQGDSKDSPKEPIDPASREAPDGRTSPKASHEVARSPHQDATKVGSNDGHDVDTQTTQFDQGVNTKLRSSGDGSQAPGDPVMQQIPTAQTGAVNHDEPTRGALREDDTSESHVGGSAADSDKGARNLARNGSDQPTQRETVRTPDSGQMADGPVDPASQEVPEAAAGHLGHQSSDQAGSGADEDPLDRRSASTNLATAGSEGADRTAAPDVAAPHPPPTDLSTAPSSSSPDSPQVGDSHEEVPGPGNDATDVHDVSPSLEGGPSNDLTEQTTPPPPGPPEGTGPPSYGIDWLQDDNEGNPISDQRTAAEPHAKKSSDQAKAQEQLNKAEGTGTITHRGEAHFGEKAKELHRHIDALKVRLQHDEEIVRPFFIASSTENPLVALTHSESLLPSEGGEQEGMRTQDLGYGPQHRETNRWDEDNIQIVHECRNVPGIKIEGYTAEYDPSAKGGVPITSLDALVSGHEEVLPSRDLKEDIPAAVASGQLNSEQGERLLEATSKSLQERANSAEQDLRERTITRQQYDDLIAGRAPAVLLHEQTRRGLLEETILHGNGRLLAICDYRETPPHIVQRGSAEGVASALPTEAQGFRGVMFLWEGIEGPLTEVDIATSKRLYDSGRLA